MAYAGITEDYDVQESSDDYFTTIVFWNNLATKSCPVNTIPSNATPVVNAGLDYTIPFGTAFCFNRNGFR
jgi:hypothetical protein